MYMDSDRLDVKSERINMNRTEKINKLNKLILFFDPTANFWQSAIAWYLIPKFLILAFRSTA